MKRANEMIGIRRAIWWVMLLVMGMLLTIPLHAERLYVYEADGNPIPLNLLKDVISVGFVEGITNVKKEEITARFAIFSDQSNWITYHEVGITQIPFREQVPEELIESTVSALKTLTDVTWATPAFEIDGLLHIVSDRFIVRFLPDLSHAIINTLNETQHVEIVEETDWDANTFILRTTKQSASHALDMANFYHNLPQVMYAEPDFFREVKVVTNDTYYSTQWFLNNTGGSPYWGTPDADIDAPEAWALTTGDPDIVVAILDDGLQITHPDLNDHVETGYDAVDGDNNPTPNSWDGHGTSCSGLAAAETNNSLGVAAIGYNCHVMGCRIFYSAYSGGPLIGYTSWTAGGINYARTNADVMSMSWHSSSSSTVTNAINYAYNNGRGGLGNIICCASGNANANSINYPANLSTTIACGATNEDDHRCDPGDWGSGQGSNYGTLLDVVAPGKWQTTTDITGSGGYSGGDYTIAGSVGTFGGTSGATPLVAGAAALVLSADPSLTTGQVQGILEQTADDQVGDPAEDTPGFDIYMGWGRINVAAAVDSVMPNFPPPLNLDAGDGNDGYVPLNWNPPVRTLSHYRIYRSTVSSSGPYSVLDSTSNTTYTDSAVVNGSTYWYKLKAIYTAPDGESVFSNIDSGTPQAPTFPPPTNLVATSGQDAVVPLAWTAPSRTLSHYHIYRSETGEFGTYNVLDSTNITTHNDYDVVNGNIYWYKLKAVYITPSGESIFSNVDFGIPGLPNQPPEITHDPMHDSDVPTPTLTAIVTDDYTSSMLVMLYHRFEGGGFSSAIMSATANPDEFSATVPVVSQGLVEYYIMAADDSGAAAYEPPGAPSVLHSFDLGDIDGDELAYDDGGWEYTTHTGDSLCEWAVRFTPTIYPFYLKGAKVSLGHGFPDMPHQRFIVKVYDDDGPDYYPQTVLWGPDTTGSIGNVIGGMEILDRNYTYWAPVVVRDSLGIPLLIEEGDFYISVRNIAEGSTVEAFNRDSSSWTAGLGSRSYVYDACEEGWYSEDDTTIYEHARQSHRMIRALGGTLAQVSYLFIERDSNNVRLYWPDNGSPFYSIYSDSIATGGFTNQQAVLPDTSWLDIGASTNNQLRFYQVRGSLYGDWGN